MRQCSEYYDSGKYRRHGSPEKGHYNEAGLGYQGRLPGEDSAGPEFRHQREGGRDFCAHHSLSQERVFGEI